MSRTLARENAFRTIYSKLFDSSFDGVEASDDLTGKFNLDFYTDLVSAFETNYDELKEKVSSNLKGITIDRVYKVDLALLYLALAEIEYLKSPVKVVINEVVELAKKYSTEKSSKFVNGFIAGLIK